MPPSRHRTDNMQKIPLQIEALRAGSTQGSYAVTLGELGGKRKLPIVIGTFEAQSIAIYLEGIDTGRPLTHDLFVNFANQSGVLVKEVLIDKLETGVFHAKLICETHKGLISVDARSSDAIALAVRFDCPIFTTEEIMQVASVNFEDDTPAADGETPGRQSSDHNVQTPKSFQDNLKEMPMSDLEKMLDDALRVEDYYKAAMIRDEIANREKK